MKNSIERALKQLLDFTEDRTISMRPYLYDIGQPKHQYNLCFDKDPSANLYYNSFFIKMMSYKSINQALDFVNHHYSQYQNKSEFLSFLENEILDVTDLITHGIRLPSDQRKQRILNSCMKWLNDQRSHLHAENEHIMRHAIEAEIIEVINEIRNAKIETNPSVDPKKVILLFLALQRSVVDEKNVGVLKYKHTVELPHILKYFTPFRHNKLDAIRKQTTILSDPTVLARNVPQYLTTALHRFFFAESVSIDDP